MAALPAIEYFVRVDPVNVMPWSRINLDIRWSAAYQIKSNEVRGSGR